MLSFLPKDSTGIQLTKIQYGTHTQPLFRDLNALFSFGDITAIMGPNGSGKSTLLRMVAGIAAPKQGEIWYQAQSIWKHPHYRQQLGYVPALPVLYSHLSVLENLYLCASLKKLQPSVCTSSIIAALAQTGLLNYQKVLFGKLSEGLKKRVMLASQLVHQPSVLLLDEPCAELDPLQRQQLWQLLAQLKTPQRLIVLSSHHPQEISTLCTKMYFLQQGKLTLLSSEQAFSQALWPRPDSLGQNVTKEVKT